jgi:uncharacterized protein (DUF1330 family)
MVMSALFIVFVEKPEDHAEIEKYRKLGMPTLAAAKPRFVVGPGCEVTTVEGDDVEVVVALEFPSVEAAKGWYHSPDYQEALKHRLSTAKSRAVIVEKFKPPEAQA